MIHEINIQSVASAAREGHTRYRQAAPAIG
jgi:hypothetical protein